MSIETTVEEAQKKAGHERDLAPLSPAQELNKAADELTSIGQPQTEDLIHLEKQPRKKTSGEKVFDGVTYAGVALLGNEAASLVIMEQLNRKNWFSKSFIDFRTWCEKTSEKMVFHVPRYISGDHTISEIEQAMAPAGKAAEAHSRVPTLLYATLGGMLMVLPVKWLEDNKGAIVRKFDNWIHGKKAQEDPNMVAAHAEMEQAPKQTWESLGKGRIVTVIAALAADATFGWRHSLSAKLLKGTKAEKFSSLDHIADEIAKKSVDMFVKGGKTMTLEQKVKAPLFEPVHVGAWLLTLSSTLTALFYVTSKVMAQNQQTNQQKKAHQTEHALTSAPRDEQPAPAVASYKEAALDMNAETPTVRVSNITHHEAIHAPEQAAQLS